MNLSATELPLDRNVPAAEDFSSIVGGTRVIGGGPAYPGQFPSVVALVRDGFSTLAGRQFCGGTVVANYWVMTAAHCLFDGNNRPFPASSIRVVEGITDLREETPDEEIIVTNVFVHPGYDHESQSAYDDIALIELATALSSEAVSLFNGDVTAHESDDGMIVGWGAIEYESAQRAVYPDALQFATVPLVSNERCNDVQSYDGYVGEGQLCAGFEEGGVDSCVGDSGGPLFVDTGGRVQQVGVVSYGRGCAEPFFYGIYTSVAAYIGWIGDYIELPGETAATPDQPRDAGDGGDAPSALVPIDQDDDTDSDDDGGERRFIGSGSVFGPPILALFVLLRVCRNRARAYRNSERI